jgi:hypothetical protein
MGIGLSKRPLKGSERHSILPVMLLQLFALNKNRVLQLLRFIFPSLDIAHLSFQSVIIAYRQNTNISFMTPVTS